MIRYLFDILFGNEIGLGLVITTIIAALFGGVTFLGFFVGWAAISFFIWAFFSLPYRS